VGRPGINRSRGRQQWGILGGIFDPIHLGHLAIAEEAREELELTGVRFVPAGSPVHKDAPRAAASHRLRMIELAIAGNPTFVVDPIEINSDRPSYTVHTLEQLSKRSPECDWTLIVSAEAARALPGWRNPDRILELARVAVVPRLGYPDLTPDWLAASFPNREDRFTILDTTHLGHSSTDIRDRIRNGRSIRY
jgi:nicotinate-nucleotide adenylyltransferase